MKDMVRIGLTPGVCSRLGWDEPHSHFETCPTGYTYFKPLQLIIGQINIIKIFIYNCLIITTNFQMANYTQNMKSMFNLLIYKIMSKKL